LVVGCGDSSSSSYSGPTALPDAVRDAARNGNPAVAWNAIPNTWRGQADGLMHDFSKAVPATLYDKVMATFGKLASVLQSKKSFVLGSSVVKAGMAELTSAQQSQVNQTYDVVVAFVHAVASSDLRTTSTLSQATVSGLLRQVGPPAHTMMITMVTFASQSTGPDALQAKTVLAVIESIKNLTATIDSQAGTNAEISISLPGLPAQSMQALGPLGDSGMFKMPMFEVGGSWVPAPLMSEWPQGIAEAKSNIAELATQFAPDNPKSQQGLMMVQMGLGMFETALDGMAKATTQAEFDQSIAGLMGLMGGFGN
jgi:hypothetical protein